MLTRVPRRRLPHAAGIAVGLASIAWLASPLAPPLPIKLIFLIFVAFYGSWLPPAGQLATGIGLLMVAVWAGWMFLTAEDGTVVGIIAALAICLAIFSYILVRQADRTA